MFLIKTFDAKCVPVKLFTYVIAALLTSSYLHRFDLFGSVDVIYRLDIVVVIDQVLPIILNTRCLLPGKNCIRKWLERLNKHTDYGTHLPPIFYIHLIILPIRQILIRDS